MLRACPGCSRHVRVSEPACPFCCRKLDDAFRLAPSPRGPAVGRLSRAALFALGAGGIAAGSACGGMSEQGYGGPACEGEGCVQYGSADGSVEESADGAVPVFRAPDARAAADGAPRDGGDAASVDPCCTSGLLGDQTCCVADAASNEASVDSAASEPVDAGTFLIFYGAPPH